MQLRSRKAACHPNNCGSSLACAQPKYAMTCLKWQLGISLMGDIILWTGPHLGIEPDAHIWEDTWAEHPFKGWERCTLQPPHPWRPCGALC